MGQQAYSRGVYDKSVQILEAALDNIERGSRLGGEVGDGACDARGVGSLGDPRWVAICSG